MGGWGLIGGSAISCGIRIVRSTAIYGQLAGHRGWVREGDVPPPTEGKKLLVFLQSSSEISALHQFLSVFKHTFLTDLLPICI